MVDTENTLLDKSTCKNHVTRENQSSYTAELTQIVILKFFQVSLNSAKLLLNAVTFGRNI